MNTYSTKIRAFQLIITLFISINFIYSQKGINSSNQELTENDFPVEVKINEGLATSIHAMACSDNGKFLALGGKKIFKLIDFKTGIELFTLNIDNNDVINSIEFSPDNKFIAFQGGMTIYIADLSLQKIVKSFSGSAPFFFSNSNKLFGFCHGINAFKDRIHRSQSIKDVLDLLSGNLNETINEKELAVNNRVYIYETKNWERYAHIPTPITFVGAMQVTPNDDQLILSLIDTSGYKIEPVMMSVNTIIKRNQGQKEPMEIDFFTPEFSEKMFRHIEVSSNGHFILFANDFEVFIWDIKESKIKYRYKSKSLPLLEAQPAVFGKRPNEFFLFENISIDNEIHTKIKKVNFFSSTTLNEFSIPIAASSIALNKETEVLISSDLRLDDQKLLRIFTGKYKDVHQRDNTIRYWEILSGKQIKYFKRNNSIIPTFSCQPNQNIIYNQGAGIRTSEKNLLQPNLSKWDLVKGEKNILLNGGSTLIKTNSLNTIVFANSGQIIFKRRNDEIFQFPTKVEINKDLGELVPKYKSISIHPTNNTLIINRDGITAGLPGNLGIKEGGKIEKYGLLESFPKLDSIQIIPKTFKIDTFVSYQGIIKSCSFSIGHIVHNFSGDKILAYGPLNVYVLNEKNLDLIASIPHEHMDDINDANFTLSNITPIPNSKEDQIAFYNGSGKIIIWDIRNNKFISSFDGYPPIKSSPDGNFLLVKNSNNDKTFIDIVHIKSHKLIGSIFDTNPTIHTIEFTSNPNLFITAHNNGIMSIYNLKQQKKILDLIELEGENYIFVNSEGYYKTNNQIPENFLGFSKNENVFPFEQFDLKYNRPDTILSVLGFASDKMISSYKKAYQKRLKKLNFTEYMLSADFHVPKIQITTKELPISTHKSEIAIGINVTDTKRLLDRINVYINNVPIYGMNGIDLRDKNIRNFQQTLNLKLSNGQNKIQLSALNQGGAESLKETIYITYNGRIKKPDLYLVTIGAEKFENSNLNLKYPIKDLKDFTQLYKKNSEQYENIITENLFNNNITIDNLKRIKKILQESRVDDQVILFVAGHGILDKDLDYYLATPNMDFSNPSDGGILYGDLENLLDGIPARNKLFLMDACHSGEIDKSETELVKNKLIKNDVLKFRAFDKVPKPKHLGLGNSFELMKELFVDLRRGTGATVISSASGVEFAWESEKWNNSVFAYSLLSGLKEMRADINKDGKVMVSELQTYLAKEVALLTNGLQQPTMRVENISNDFQIW